MTMPTLAFRIRSLAAEIAPVLPDIAAKLRIEANRAERLEDALDDLLDDVRVDGGWPPAPGVFALHQGGRA